MEVATGGERGLVLSPTAKVVGSIVKIGCTVTETGLEIVGDPSIDDWLEAFDHVRDFKDVRCKWYLGDLLNEGERRYGEMYSQALDATDRSYASLSKYAVTAEKIPKSVRRPGVSFEAHYQVRNCLPDDMTHILANAELHELTSQQVGRMAAGESIEDVIAPPEDKPLTFDDFEKQSTRLQNFLDKWGEQECDWHETRGPEFNKLREIVCGTFSTLAAFIRETEGNV